MNEKRVKKIPLEIKYKKQNGLFVFDLNALKVPSDIQIKEKALVMIPPQQFGGNHKHPRVEVMLAINQELELHWLDEKNVRHKEKMTEGENFYLFIVPSYVPHAVINISKTQTAALYELANEAQRDVETIQVI